MTLFQDLRYAIRMLRKNPGFASVAILTLALGIGANTAMFSIINGVLLSPLSYRDADRIVVVSTFWKQTGATTPRLTGGDLVDIRSDGQIFDALSYYVGGEMGVQLAGRAEFTGAYFVNPGFFHVFGVQPAYGRLLDDNDVNRSALVSQPFAERNFGAASSALGRTLRIENQTYEIAGVLPSGIQFPRKTDVWVLGAFIPENLNRTADNYRTVARLRSGVTLDTAEAHLQTIGERPAAAFPDSNRNKTFVAVSFCRPPPAPGRPTPLFFIGSGSAASPFARREVLEPCRVRA